MPTVTIEATAPTSLEESFAYITDYANTPDWFYGIKKFEPLTELVRGVGSTFDVVVQIGAPLKSTVTCTELDEGKLFVLESTKGIKNESRWTFAALPDGQTAMKCELSYHLGGGIAGAALSRLVEPFVAIAVKHTAHSLVTQLSAR